MKSASSPIDIEGIYKDYIDSKQEENRKERYEGNEHWYHASGAGSCSRKLYFESVEKAEPSNPIDTRTMRLLRLGNVVHEDIQNSLTRTRNSTIHSNIDSTLNTEKENKNKEKELEFDVEGEVKIKELNVRGFYDIVAKQKESDNKKVYLYDIKTCGSWSWKMKFGRTKQFNPSIHYELQLGTYGYAIKEMFGQLDGMYLYYYNKDNSDMRAIEVPLTYISRAYLFWKNINDEHKQGLPDFRVGVSPVQKWQCNYCQFRSHCNPPR
jgi:CRISPR/Cas system-associated exonuclease Cas4 (RecB family)